MISPEEIPSYTPQSHNFDIHFFFFQSRGKRRAEGTASHGILKMGLCICFITKVAQQEDENPSKRSRILRDRQPKSHQLCE